MKTYKELFENTMNLVNTIKNKRFFEEENFEILWDNNTFEKTEINSMLSEYNCYIKEIIANIDGTFTLFITVD